MTLAAILVLLLLNPAPWGYAPQDQTAPASQTQTVPAQDPKSSASTPAAANTKINQKAQPKKKNATDCASSPGNSNDPKSGSTNAANNKKPCPPQKVIVKDGGSDQPIVQLKGDTPPSTASNERLNTEQLQLATEDNLKKIAGRQLNPNQQEMVNQIKQFMEQSKAAVTDGDLERGHNLAMKARLLSDELVNP